MWRWEAMRGRVWKAPRRAASGCAIKTGRLARCRGGMTTTPAGHDRPEDIGGRTRYRRTLVRLDRQDKLRYEYGP